MYKFNSIHQFKHRGIEYSYLPIFLNEYLVFHELNPDLYVKVVRQFKHDRDIYKTLKIYHISNNISGKVLKELPEKPGFTEFDVKDWEPIWKLFHLHPFCIDQDELIKSFILATNIKESVNNLIQIL